jgi:NAD dependent epimerase/dehydratase family enzyme
MRMLRRTYGVRIGLPATRWMLEAGAVFLGTETELVLKSRRVVPERLLASGYRFRFSEIGGAIRDLAEE